jgi:biotin synthase
MEENTAYADIKNSAIRHNWQLEEILALYALPFNDLLFKAQTTHRQFFNPNEVQLSTLLSIKTGGCPENCSYCPQSAHYEGGVEASKLMDVEDVLKSARQAKDAGAARFCMGAAWREPKERDMPAVAEIIKGVKDLGLETCMTLGMLNEGQAKTLKEAGLDYYNHNIDTSEEYYKEIITTRTYQERLDTLENVRKSDMKVCCGGIVGMGEKPEDRAKMLQTLANLPEHPQSVPINLLIKIEGTPLDTVEDLDILDFVRTIAVARIMLPASYVRLSAGREDMSDEAQSLCFFAGANSIFYGEKLLTAANPEVNEDMELLKRLGISPDNNSNKEDKHACSA